MPIEAEPREGQEAGDNVASDDRVAVKTVNVGGVAMLALAALAVAGLWLGREEWQELLVGRAMGPDVVAVVDGARITVRDVDLELAIQEAIQAELGRVLLPDEDDARAFRQDMIDDLVDRRLLLAAAGEAGLSVTDGELDAALPALGREGGYDMASLEARLAESGVTSEELRAWARDRVLAAGFVAMPQARELGLQRYRERGMSGAELEAQTVTEADVASALQLDADIQFNVGGEARFKAAAEGEEAPDLALTDLAGNTHRLSEYRGRPVLVNFWATWCKPCREEMPLLVEALADHAADGLAIIAIDVQESADVVRQSVTEQQLPFTVLLDRDGQLATIYRVRGLPSTYFVTSDGVLAKAHRGQIESARSLSESLQLILPPRQ